MRRTAVFHLVLYVALAGLAAPAGAASRHRSAPAAKTASAASKTAKGRAERRAAERATEEDPCGGLSRSGRRACEADLAKAAKAGRAREAEAPRGADPCAKLSRSKRSACERDVEAADIVQARHAERSGRRPAAPAAPPRAAPVRAATTAAAKREVQPSDLVGGVETPAAATGAPALRGSLAADVAVPVASAPARTAATPGRRSGRLHEVVLEDGQSLADLAAASGMSVDDLARLNGVSSVEDIPTGTRLKVPGAASSSTVASVRTPPQAPVETPSTAPSAAPAARETRRTVASAAPSAGPRPYSSLGPVGSGPEPSAPSRGRWSRTQQDAMAAYAVASARAPHVADREEARHDRFVWPVRAEVVSAYGDHGTGRRNDGVDLAAGPGDAVRAAAAGEVVYAGKEIAAAGGNLVLLKHADGWVTAYSHLGRLTVAMRQTVQQGQEIAEAPDVAGSAVHFEVRQPGAGGAKPVDPASVLPSRDGPGETGRG